MQLLSMTRTLARSLLAPRYRSAWSRTPGGVAQPCAVEETGGRENSPSFLTTGAPDSWQHPKKIATVEPAELRTVHRERCVCPNDGQVPVVGPQDPRCTANGRRGGTGFWSHSDDGSLRLCAGCGPSQAVPIISMATIGRTATGLILRGLRFLRRGVAILHHVSSCLLQPLFRGPTAAVGVNFHNLSSGATRYAR